MEKQGETAYRLGRGPFYIRQSHCFTQKVETWEIRNPAFTILAWLAEPNITSV
ncbi:hypothetical protein DQG13_21535 [Paenibacillus sp. YN15]|nr:hypothetical protein DQG13_21535 [Paenibacillus sp. YN15]